MKILQINTVYAKGSTGKIAHQIQEVLLSQGHQGCVAYRYAENGHLENTYEISTWWDCHVHNRLARYTWLIGCFSRIRTKKFCRFLDKEQPDIIHLHNLHGSYINLPILFKYIKSHHIPMIWTLHDCWSFTGHCPYFDIAHCDKWKTGCHNCPQYREYPQSLFDNSKFMWKLKKKWFTGVENMTIVTPSQWLADLVKQSYLKDYPVKVINNGIDLSVFKPADSDFREKYHISADKEILLGVAFGWGKRKGLDVFLELDKRLDAEKYQIVLVGTDDAVDKQLPENIISIHRTQNQQELAEIYSAADLFVNPTREENYPTVNMESIACGTPVLTFNTGGSPEIPDDTCGAVVPCDDVDAMEREIVRICRDKPFTKEVCLARAKAFDMNDRFEEYVELYKEVLHE